MSTATSRVRRLGLSFVVSPIWLTLPLGILAPRIVEGMHLDLALLGFDDIMFGIIFKTFGWMEVFGIALLFCSVTTDLTFRLLHHYQPTTPLQS